jgi:hypothetical protein
MNVEIVSVEYVSIQTVGNASATVKDGQRPQKILMSWSF